MRIVELKEFLTLPSGTVYHRYGPPKTMACFESLEIKLESIPEYNDWSLIDLIGAVKHDCSEGLFEELGAAGQDSSLSIETEYDCGGRNGSYPDAERFAVLEEQDVRGLIAALQETLGTGGSESAPDLPRGDVNA